MGTTCHCQRIDSEEDFLNHLLNSMNLNNIEVKSAYNQFIKCYNKDEGYLDYFLYKNFLNEIVGDGSYREYQLAYFENIRKLDQNNHNVKLLGILIIYLAKGSSYHKIDVLYRHYNTFYCLSDDRTIKEFIRDIINCHTEICLVSFKQILNVQSLRNMTNNWKKGKKLSLLNEIYKNFISIKKKYSEWKTKLSLTDSFKPKSKFNSEVIDRHHNYTNCEFYIRNRFNFVDEKFNMSKEELMIREFIELSFHQLDGQYIRTWLYEESLKENIDSSI
jgi:hypothetical protein